MARQDLTQIFNDIIERAKSLDPANTRKWFDELEVVHLDGGALLIAADDNNKVQFLQDNCTRTFTLAAQQVTGHLVTVDFRTNGQGRNSLKSDLPTKQRFKLHPDYTFDNFVVGPSNRLAQASCVAVSQSPGDTYNPLFIYGNSGLGKTHLLHAVCHGAREKHNNAVIEFLSCEEFVNRFIRAIEQGNSSGFQNQFRSVDVLVIDDVQFLSDREQSQEEFFHTFNALYNNGKQIILSADNCPSDIPALEERLISRFSWGLVTRIDPPSHDTRVAILKKKAHIRGIEISDDIAEYIARKVRANIRELEGALTSLQALALTKQEDISLELAKAALGDEMLTAAKNTSITDIIEVVTQHYDVRLADLQSKRRSQSITLPRQICMYLARNLTRHSLEEIGGHLGGRDHTTVMHACSKIGKAEHDDPQMHATLSELTRQITQTK
ncbi:MAG: chromosomal replication initiator protein DnaA [Sedimentisphaerales bacterium]|nr:chromosomal replication initiator protein DnaA [Sedimentisphaerales bacterium]